MSSHFRKKGKDLFLFIPIYFIYDDVSATEKLHDSNVMFTKIISQ